jgi:hypothetical protein
MTDFNTINKMEISTYFHIFCSDLNLSMPSSGGGGNSNSSSSSISASTDRLSGTDGN